MSTKSEITISAIWDIFKVEIVSEVPGGKLIFKSSWGEGWKERGIFFSFLWGDQKEGEGGIDFLFHFKSRKKDISSGYVYTDVFVSPY